MLIPRRHLLLGAAAVSAARPTSVNDRPMPAIQNRVSQWYYSSEKAYEDPFNDVELDVLFTDPNGREYRVPAFWAGDQTWGVRFSAPTPGLYTFKTECTDSTNGSLHNQAGSLQVEPYGGKNVLYRHGQLRVAADRRHLEHVDGTPFFWLADTWWDGFSKRFRWPEDVQELTADRATKGFTVVQIAAGMLPIMEAFDPRAANEAGFPWERSYRRVNPAFFNLAELRIQHLIEKGLLPCVFGSWGYHLLMMGIPRMKQHWRYLIGRWGAYPVVWCLAGEGNMPWYTSKTKKQDRAALEEGWTEVARYVRKTDPYHRLLTMHPINAVPGREVVRDASLIDFDMLQTGHSPYVSIPLTIHKVRRSAALENPQMPVLNAEVLYEGVFGENWAPIQRFTFWACILSGALVGHTYGAAGIWEFNTTEENAAMSPDGQNWSETTWNVAYKLPGSGQLGLSKAFLVRYPWWRLEPHPEWVDPHWNEEPHPMPIAAGIPGQLRIVFIPSRWLPKIMSIEQNVSYRAHLFDPVAGREFELGTVEPDNNGEWQMPRPSLTQEWVLVFESKEFRKVL